jgi:flagella basal body P-ring formation protein FlgA
MKRWAVVLGILLLGLALSGSAPKGRAAAELILEIPEQVTVAGPKISLADLGRLQGADSADRDFLGNLELGLAPLPGQTRFFTRSYLEFICKQQKGHRCPALLMGPKVAVRVEAVAIEGSAIAAAIDRLLPPLPAGIIKQWVQIQNLPETVWLPKGKWRIEAVAVDKRLALGTNVFNVKLIGETEFRIINLTGVVHKTAAVYRAKRFLTAKTQLNEENFDKIEIELATGREYTGNFPKEYRNIRSLRQGQVLLAETLQPLPQVCQGSEVQVTFHEGGVLVRVTGYAKQDGWSGDRITLINPVSKKEFQGRVAGPGVVEISD